MRIPQVHSTAIHLCAALLVALCSSAAAQSVSLQGALGDSKALLVINGAPVTLAVGATTQGVTLRSLRNNQAEVEVDGRRQLLSIGSAPVSVGGGGGWAKPGEIVLPIGPGGHFYAQGAINGRPVSFLVDTGATTVAMSVHEAERIGLNWRNGQRAMGRTAGGAVPIYVVTLGKVRLGDVEVFNVEAAITPTDMPHILLGNSFLSRFEIKTTYDTMRLTRTR